MSLRERLALSGQERVTSGAEQQDAPNQAYQELKFYDRINQTIFRRFDLAHILMCCKWETYFMYPNLHVAIVSNVAILAAALELRRIHGLRFALRFLEPYSFDRQVLKELFK